MAGREGLLVVDDDYRFLVGVQRALGARRAVFTARTHREARERLQSESIGIAIVDERLEQESGVALLFELRDRLPTLKTALLSGFVTPELALAAASAQARVIASKPRRISEVVAAVEAHSGGTTLTLIATPLMLPDGERLPMKAMQRRHAEETVERHNGNLTAAARELQISRNTLYDLVFKDDLEE